MKAYINTRVLKSDLTGVQRYTQELVRHLQGRIEVIAPSFRMRAISGHLWEQLVLPKRVAGAALLSPSNTGPLACARQVVTVHDVVALDHPEWLNPRFASWYRFLTPKLVRRVDRVITISEFSKQRLLTHVRVPDEKIVVIHNGIDARFRPIDGSEVRRKLTHLALPSPHYVLCVGSLEPRKNLGRLLRAWARVLNSIPTDIWLVLAGKRGSPHVFRQAVGLSELPARVHMAGHVSDDLLPALYAGALVFAFPSVYEGFGLPPLEAMASGVPVLAGNRTSLQEVIGDAGLLVDPYDVDALTDGLRYLIDNSDVRADFRRKGLERAKQFSWEKTAERTWSVLAEIMT